MLTPFAIHCLTKATAFVPQCEKWSHQIGAIKYAKRNFPSCSLCSQFTASQKPPLLFPNAKIMEPSKWSHQIRKKKFPLLLTPFAIHCLTKATAFVPQCEKWSHQNGAIKYAKRNFPSCSLRSQFTASQKPPLLFPNAKIMEPSKWSHQIRKKKLPLLLTLFAIHCLTKATAFVPQCSSGPILQFFGFQKLYYDIWSQAYIRTREFGFVRFAHSLRSLCSLSKFFTRLGAYARTANPIPLLD